MAQKQAHEMVSTDLARTITVDFTGGKLKDAVVISIEHKPGQTLVGVQGIFGTVPLASDTVVKLEGTGSYRDPDDPLYP